MMETKSLAINMLEMLIENALEGKRIELSAEPVREVFKLERDGRERETVILSMRYSGTIEGNPFGFKKSYSFTEDEAQNALECLLTANNRLQMDYDRLQEAGVAVKETFFNFQNSFMGLPGDASLKRPALRLQDFIHLSRAGIPVSVDLSLKCPDISFKQEDVEKRGFAYSAAFVFSVGGERTILEKLYGFCFRDDTTEYQEETKKAANRRLERDCERLRRVSIEVGQLKF